jgi:hypothetical protein
MVGAEGVAASCAPRAFWHSTYLASGRLMSTGMRGRQPRRVPSCLATSRKRKEGARAGHISARQQPGHGQRPARGGAQRLPHLCYIFVPPPFLSAQPQSKPRCIEKRIEVIYICIKLGALCTAFDACTCALNHLQPGEAGKLGTEPFQMCHIAAINSRGPPSPQQALAGCQAQVHSNPSVRMHLCTQKNHIGPRNKQEKKEHNARRTCSTSVAVQPARMPRPAKSRLSAAMVSASVRCTSSHHSW